MQRLIEGHSRYRREVYPAHRELMTRLGGGQSPETVIVSCSDSRVDVNALTGSLPGDIFHVRNAGNLVPPADSGQLAATAALEFAVTTLPIRDLVVCGHSGCGAMKGLLAGAGDDGAVARWLRLAGVDPADAGGDLDALIRLNVRRQLEHLAGHDFVAERVRSGRLRLWGWVYDIASSRILQLDPRSASCVPLGEAAALSA